MLPTEHKKKQLRKHKALATGLFILMACMYVFCVIYQKNAPDVAYIPYVKAFAEAAMVGALADWFAVTALFNKPLGINIPHTNLIENKKNDIGENLGDFVVENFLSEENIKPYIERLDLTSWIGNWLEDNTEQIIEVIKNQIPKILSTNNDAVVIDFIHRKSQEVVQNLNLNHWVAQLADYVLENKEHQKLLDMLFDRISVYIADNKELVRSRVRSESSSFVPAFINNHLADKITVGLINYFLEAKENPTHSLRMEVENKIISFKKEVVEKEEWRWKINELKRQLFTPQKAEQYANDIWLYIKTNLVDDLEQSNEDSFVKSYLIKNIKDFTHQLKEDATYQDKINLWVRKNLLNYMLAYRSKMGTLISKTVGNWEGKELSSKLELEVGKDLQFIRVNGTLVGGIVGLLIYTLTEWFL